jgi:hypothetical protein
MAESIEAKMSRRIGFRPYLVRAANQFQLAFGASPASLDNNRVRVCRDNWLVEEDYVTKYANPPCDLEETAAAEFVSDLKSLQDRLRASGTAMVLVISPSKAETYPEYLPEWVRERREEFVGESDLDRLRRHLASSEVVYFDTPKYFQRHKDSASQKFYTKTGIHWNYFTAFQVWRELMQLVNREYGTDWPVPEQIGVDYDRPRGTDDDIAKLLNVFFLPSVEEPVAYPIVRTKALPASDRPDFLFAGTSFSQTLVDTMYLSESGRECDYVFYTSRHLTRRGPARNLRAGKQVEFQGVDINGFASLNWDRTLLDKEIVILEMLENKVGELLCGFHAEALAALRTRTLPDRVAIRPID